MRRFLTQDKDNEPFLGFCKPVNGADGTLADVGAWTEEMHL
jgi:hypothetical protein